MAHKVEVDNLQVVHRAKLVKVKVELRANSKLYSGMVDAYNHEQLEVKRHKRQLRMTGDTISRLSTPSCQRLIKIKELKYENNRHAARVADEELNMI